LARGTVDALAPGMSFRAGVHQQAMAMLHPDIHID
jgi:hypothetical protein